MSKMDKHEKFLTQVSNFGTSVDSKISIDDYKSNPDYVIFCNILREKRYEFRKLASTYPLSKQYDEVYEVVRKLYNESDYNFGGNAKKAIQRAVRREIGIFGDFGVMWRSAIFITVVMMIILMILRGSIHIPFPLFCLVTFISAMTSFFGFFIIMVLELKISFYPYKQWGRKK